MGGVLAVLVVLAALAGVALATRHLALRLTRPGGFECSLRAAAGDVPGLGPRFRAGYAGRELDGFVWRRLAWPSPPVRFPATAVRLDEERAPSHRDHLVSVPAHFAVVPVVLSDGTRLDLALSRRKVRRVIALLG
jgi:hypothetical protein